jgi:hypothetical protein
MATLDGSDRKLCELRFLFEDAFVQFGEALSFSLRFGLQLSRLVHPAQQARFLQVQTQIVEFELELLIFQYGKDLVLLDKFARRNADLPDKSGTTGAHDGRFGMVDDGWSNTSAGPGNDQKQQSPTSRQHATQTSQPFPRRAFPGIGSHHRRDEAHDWYGDPDQQSARSQNDSRSIE